MLITIAGRKSQLAKTPRLVEICAAVRALVLTVKVEVAGFVPGVIEDEENWQVAWGGSPDAHTKLIALANPFRAVAVIVKLAGVPAATVALPGTEPMVKSGGPGY